MDQMDEFRELVSDLIDIFQEKGFAITHVNGHPGFPQSTWEHRAGEWALPVIEAVDRSRALIILGDAFAADSWNSREAEKRLDVFMTSAHEVYVMVTDAVIHAAKAKQRKERWKNVFYLSPSSRE